MSQPIEYADWIKQSVTDVLRGWTEVEIGGFIGKEDVTVTCGEIFGALTFNRLAEIKDVLQADFEIEIGKDELYMLHPGREDPVVAERVIVFKYRKPLAADAKWRRKYQARKRGKN